MYCKLISTISILPSKDFNVLTFKLLLPYLLTLLLLFMVEFHIQLNSFLDKYVTKVNFLIGMSPSHIHPSLLQEISLLSVNTHNR